MANSEKVISFLIRSVSSKKASILRHREHLYIGTGLRNRAPHGVSGNETSSVSLRKLYSGNSAPKITKDILPAPGGHCLAGRTLSFCAYRCCGQSAWSSHRASNFREIRILRSHVLPCRDKRQRALHGPASNKADRPAAHAGGRYTQRLSTMLGCDSSKGSTCETESGLWKPDPSRLLQCG